MGFVVFIKPMEYTGNDADKFNKFIRAFAYIDRLFFAHWALFSG